MLGNRGTSPLSRLQWGILALLFFSTVINYIDRQTLSVLKQTLEVDLGLRSTDYGNVTALFMFIYSVAGLALGLWIDRIGVRWGLGLGVLVWSIAAMLHGAISGFWSLCVYRSLMALGEGVNWPAGGKAVARWLPPDRRAFAMGLFDGGSAIGAVLAPPLVGTLTTWFGWRATFVVTGFTGIVWLIVWYWLYDDPTRHRWLTQAQRDAHQSEQQGEAVGRTSFWASTRMLIELRTLWGLIVVRFLATPVWWFYVFWLPGYLQAARGFTLIDLARWAWIPYLTCDAGKLVGGLASDGMLRRGFGSSTSRKAVMIGGALFMAFGLFVTHAPGAAGSVALVSVATFGFGCWSANTLALHADCFPSRLMGTALGLTGLSAALGGSAFTWLAGRIVERAGYGYVFLVAGIAPLLASAVLVFGVNRADEPNESA